MFVAMLRDDEAGMAMGLDEEDEDEDALFHSASGQRCARS